MLKTDAARKNAQFTPLFKSRFDDPPSVCSAGSSFVLGSIDLPFYPSCEACRGELGGLWAALRRNSSISANRLRSNGSIGGSSGKLILWEFRLLSGSKDLRGGCRTTDSAVRRGGDWPVGRKESGPPFPFPLRGKPGREGSPQAAKDGRLPPQEGF